MNYTLKENTQKIAVGSQFCCLKVFLRKNANVPYHENKEKFVDKSNSTKHWFILIESFY